MAEGLWAPPPPGNGSDCPDGARWVLRLLGECARDGRDVGSALLGLLSIGCFAAAALPQFYQACKTGIMDRALSIYFLLGWLGGDLLNLIGSFLANQLPLQVYTAVYYVLADLVMLSLYGYYKAKNWGAGATTSINAACLFCLLGTATTLMMLSHNTGPALDPAAFRGRSLLSLGPEGPGPEPISKTEIIGFAIGSVSSVLYLCSRLPQIYTNVSEGSRHTKSWSEQGSGFLPSSLLGGCSSLISHCVTARSEARFIFLPLQVNNIISFQFLAYRTGQPSAGEEREALLAEHGDS
uniref:Solute carrier family 66 member 1 n=1 Tax=Pavo cristatus TaxID=9049 RepID=A0A8C9EKS6_PAVCR